MPSPDQATGPGPVLSVDGLRKTFGSGDSAVTAVDDVSLEVGSGTVVGLLGPNGAGKTTTIKSMLGLVVPDTGTVEICGIDVHEQPGRAYDHIGAMLEGARNIYWRLTVRENLAYFAGLGGSLPSSVRERHDRLLEQFALAEESDTVVNELSRGMKQKVSLASTLSRDVDVVFLDEPTLGLDVETSLELRSELRSLAEEDDVTIVLCSHDMDVIEAVCDRVVVLNDGRIIADDQVDGLIDLFETQEYHVTVGESLTAELRQRLERSFDATCRDTGAGLTIEVTAEDGEVVYELLELLRTAGATLLDIDSVEPDLEEVFLRLTDSEASTGPGGSGLSETVSGPDDAAGDADRPDDSGAADPRPDEGQRDATQEVTTRGND
jgi:ABC-2 type transport system ATP-binding protein